MILGRVVGTVWATRKDPRLSQHKLLLVRPYFYYNPTHDTELLVAADSGLCAGKGDDVLLCLGSPARWAAGGANLPIDAAVMAVVDRCQLQRAAFQPGAEPRPLRFIGGALPRGLEWVD